MNCQEAAEFVSALFDGEAFPCEAAEHIGGCASCEARLRDYALMGAELRLAAAARRPATIADIRCIPTKPIARVWLLGWRQTMQIPRFVVALAVFFLIAAAGIVLVRAKEQNRWFEWTVSGRDGKSIVSATTPIDSSNDPYYTVEAGVPGQDGTVWFHLRALGLKDGAERIGARTVWLARGVPGEERTARLVNLSRQPEREFLCAPGSKLLIPVEGYGNLQIEGQFRPNQIGRASCRERV